VDAPIWFGRAWGRWRVVSVAGAVALAFGAQEALLLANFVKASRCSSSAVPILISLLLIRLTVRVLSRELTRTRDWMRIIERQHLLDRVAGAVVLWITGVLPWLLEAMEEHHAGRWARTQISLAQCGRGRDHGRPGDGAGAVDMAAAIEKRLLSGTGSSSDLSIRMIAANLVRVLLLVIGLMFAMSAVGIDLTAHSAFSVALSASVSASACRRSLPITSAAS
jgi:hypothetical protein